MAAGLIFSKVMKLSCGAASYCRYFRSVAQSGIVETKNSLTLFNQTFPCDDWTNITSRVTDRLGVNLLHKRCHPLNLLRQRIEKYFYTSFTKSSGTPIFTMLSNLNPIVTIEQNFGSLLVPADHPSRRKTDSYYVNKEYMLRAHTSAHQVDLVRSGLDAFLVFGDAFRRDAIDSTHYHVFHQAEGVRLFDEHQIFLNVSDATGLQMFDDGRRNLDKQATHSIDAVKLVEYNLKQTLINLKTYLLGKEVKYRWVDAYFPFTHPSWELEIFHNDKWLEILGCGIMEQPILDAAGANSKIGWAFGIGLERLAMLLYNIPDIRLFWTEDERFFQQFDIENIDMPVNFTRYSVYPPCINDISFWIPEDFEKNNFFDLARDIGGDVIESIDVIDEYVHPDSNRKSLCWRIYYRHMDKTFTQQEVNVIHQKLETMAAELLGVEIR